MYNKNEETERPNISSYGRLFVVGVGPGDPELLTLKGVRVLNETQCIFVPKGREEGSSLALSIIKDVVTLNGKDVVEAYFPMHKTREPKKEIHSDINVAVHSDSAALTRSADFSVSMQTQDTELEKESSIAEVQKSSSKNDAQEVLASKWQDTVDKVVDRLEHGMDVAFITIGDPAIYSTFFYLYDSIVQRISSVDLHIEIIPGVSSINAAAARARISLGLGNEKIAVLPANYLGNLKQTIELFDTVVMMKINTVFDEIVEILREMRITGKGKATVISRAFMDDELIEEDIEKIDKTKLSYFSLMIVRK